MVHKGFNFIVFKTKKTKLFVYPSSHQSDANKAGLLLRNGAIQGAVCQHMACLHAELSIFIKTGMTFSLSCSTAPLIHKEELNLSVYYPRLD